MTVLWSVNRQDNAYSSPLQGSHFKKYWVFSWMHTCAFTWGHSDLKHQVLAAVETEGSKLSELMVGGTFLCHRRQVASITAPHTLQWVSHVEMRLSTARDNLCKLGMVAAVVSFILIQFTISIFRVKFYCANFELESSQVKSIVFSFPSSTIVMVRAGGGTWLFQGKKKKLTNYPLKTANAKAVFSEKSWNDSSCVKSHLNWSQGRTLTSFSGGTILLFVVISFKVTFPWRQKRKKPNKNKQTKKSTFSHHPPPSRSCFLPEAFWSDLQTSCRQKPWTDVLFGTLLWVGRGCCSQLLSTIPCSPH